MTTKKIVFMGVDSDNHYARVWSRNAQELGYLSDINNISGLSRSDIVIYDKRIPEHAKDTRAVKVLFFPDVFSEDTEGYLGSRKVMFEEAYPFADVLIVPPNPKLIAYAQKKSQKPVFAMLFGVYTNYFSFVRSKYPHKKEDLGFCWSPFSQRRDALARNLQAKRIHLFGQEMIDAMRPFRYMLNGHYTDILNNEQRLTEIPLAMAIPVSEELADPSQLQDLHIVPVSEYKADMYTLQEQKEIVRHNLRTVYEKYNSRVSLAQIISNVTSTSVYRTR